MSSLDTPRAGRWPIHLQSLSQRLLAASREGEQPVRGEIWLVLRSALAAYARGHLGRMGQLSDTELDDVVSQKSLELLTRIDQQNWTPAAETERQIRALVSTVARNGVVDALRFRGRMSSLPEHGELGMGEIAHNVELTTPASASQRLEAEEFVENLRACVEHLSPRARKLWFFRTLYEMPSKLIARHPDIRMTGPHVDVALQRCRNALGACMEKKGLKLRALPPGTFAALWESCVRERVSLAKEEGHA